MALKRKSGESKGGQQLCLVRWVEDDQVGVMPVSSVSKDYKPRVGVTVDMRWKGKTTYKAEILKISSKLLTSWVAQIVNFLAVAATIANRVELSKLCDALVNFEITPEDIVNDDQPSENQDGQSIDSTVDLCDSTSNSEEVHGYTISAKKPKKVSIACQRLWLVF